MRLRYGLMGLITALLFTTTAHAYTLLPVIDPVNLIPNTTTSIATTLTAEQTILQVLNSNQEVAMMKQNLFPGGGQGGDDIIAFLKRLDEVLGEGNALHYQLGDLKQKMNATYPGYVDPGDMRSVLENTTGASLGTLRGAVLSVREQLKVSEILREQLILQRLESQSRQAMGNLDVTQAGNAINLEIIRELRKLRQMVGALVNVQTVAISHQINGPAGSERSVNDWLARSQIKPVAYTGVGGFGVGDIGR